MKKEVKLSEKLIRDLADSLKIFNRGKGYYQANRINEIRGDNNYIFANVIGRRSYKVKINLLNLYHSDCSCPYGGPGCKHIVAVLLRVLYDKEFLLEMKDFKSSSPKKKSGSLLSTLNFTDIVFLRKPEDVIYAFNIINNKKIEILRKNKNTYLGRIVGNEAYDLKLAVEEFFGDGRFVSQCSCRKNNLFSECKHILTFKLALLMRKSASLVPENYGEKLKEECEERKLNKISMILSEHTPKELCEPDDKYELFYTVSQDIDGVIRFKILYAKQVQSDKLSPKKVAEDYFLKRNRAKFSEEERQIISLYLSRGDTDLIFEKLKRLYPLHPEKFFNCEFPNERAKILLEIKEDCPNEKIDSTNKKMYDLVFSIFNSGKKFSIKRHNFVFGKDGNWVGIKKDNGSYIFFELEKNVSCPILRYICKHPKISFSEELLSKFIETNFYNISSLFEFSISDTNQINQISGIEPVPMLFLKRSSGNLLISMGFRYNEKEVPYHISSDLIYKNGDSGFVKIVRDREKEKYFLGKLLESKVMSIGENFCPLIPAMDWVYNSVTELIDSGFEFYGLESITGQNIKKDRPRLSIEVSSGIDWFDLNAEVSFGETKTDFSEVIERLSRGERFVRLDNGALGIIPKKWTDALSGIVGFLQKSNNKNSFRALNSQIEIVESLLDIADKYKTDKEYNKFKKKLKSFRSIKNCQLPNGLNCSLRGYQKAGYDWLNFLNEFSFGGCLADEMGLGKTSQVLALLLREKEERKQKQASLIVVPKSLVFNWSSEIKKFTPSLSYYVHHGQDRIKNKNFPESDLVITTYGTLLKDLKILKEKTFYYIILDESQHIKNFLSKKAKAICELRSNHRLVMTGTPVENNYFDLWSQFRFLNPGFLGSYDFFRDNYVKKNEDDSRINSLRKLLNPFILMRKKELVAKELPDKQIIVRYCDMEPMQKEFYENLKQKYQVEIKEAMEEKGVVRSKMKILEGLMRLRQACNNPKMIDERFVGESGKFNVLRREVLEVISEGHKILIFSSFVKALRLFIRILEKKRIPYCYIDGKTVDRESQVKNFQNNKDIPIFLISIRAGGFGLNLTAADYVYIIDPWWNPAVEMQAIDRAHRIGQEKKIFVYKFITKNSIEEKILLLQEQKKEAVEKLITSEETFYKKLTPEMVMELFS